MRLEKNEKSPHTNAPMGKKLLPALQVKNMIETMVKSGADAMPATAGIAGYQLKPKPHTVSTNTETKNKTVPNVYISCPRLASPTKLRSFISLVPKLPGGPRTRAAVHKCVPWGSHKDGVQFNSKERAQYSPPFARSTTPSPSRINNTS